MSFLPEGNTVEREGALEALGFFCLPPAQMGLKGTAFSLLEAVEVAPMVVFIRVRATNEKIFVRGPVEYSQAMLLKEVEYGKLVLQKDVQCK